MLEFFWRQALYIGATTHHDYKGKEIALDKTYLDTTYSHVPAYCADGFPFDSQDFRLTDSQEFDDLRCPDEITGIQPCQGSAESSVPCLSECVRIGGSAPESRQESIEAGNSMFTLLENGCIGISEPERGSSTGIHEREEELNENRDAEREVNNYVDPVLDSILLDTPPDGVITVSRRDLALNAFTYGVFNLLVVVNGHLFDQF